MNIKQISEEIHATNVKNGFWEDKATKNIPEVLMLVVTELAEAVEAHRKGHHADIRSYEIHSVDDFKYAFETYIKNSFEDELADTVIRVFDLCEALNIDLEAHIRLKLEYNKTRPYKHGKKY